MGEMAWEPPPLTEVPYVPLVPDWAPNAWSALRRAFWGRGHFFVVWGFFFWLWLLWGAFKFYLYVALVALLMVFWGLSALYGIPTYRWRQKRAVARALREYRDQIPGLTQAEWDDHAAPLWPHHPAL